MADDQAGVRKQRHACRRDGAQGRELHVGRAHPRGVERERDKRGHDLATGRRVIQMPLNILVHFMRDSPYKIC